MINYYSDVVEFLIRGITPEEIDDSFIERLRRRGYVVVASTGPETPSALCDRLVISYSTLRRRLRSPWRPPVTFRGGKSGRIAVIFSNSLFDAFCRDGGNGKSDPWRSFQKCATCSQFVAK